MSVRKNTPNRLSLIRTCHTCGKTFRTSAASPFMRQMYNVDGKKQKTCYFCSQTCKQASYKHLFDGKYEERKRQHEANRDISAKNKRYYAAHAEQVRAKVKARYWANPEAARADNQYQRKKRACLALA